MPARLLLLVLSVMTLVSRPAFAQDDMGEPGGEQPAETPVETTDTRVEDSAVPESAGPVVTGLLDGLRGARQGEPVTEEDLIPLGSLDPESGHELFIRFSRYGAGIHSLQLTNYYKDTKREADQHVELQREVETRGAGVTPFSIESVVIERRTGDEPTRRVVSLQAVFDDPAADEKREKRIWFQDPSEPGRFTATIENEAGIPILEIERRYVLETGSLTLRIDQTLRNMTDEQLFVRVIEVGPVDLPRLATYPSDARRVRFAHVEANGDLRVNPSLKSRDSAVGSLGSKFEPESSLWPTDADIEAQRELAWFGMTNRFFAIAVRPAPASGDSEQALALGALGVERYVLRVGTSKADSTMTMRPVWDDEALNAGEQTTKSYAIYSGPLSKPVINKQPGAKALKLDDLVVYNYGGFCGFCTFTWLTDPLVWLLRTVHDNLVFDWALAVIVLVLIVRSILHPVTRWSQIRVQVFTKQMSEMAPKQKKLQERYKGDPDKLRKETMNLYREEGVNPAGMLGCLPMFLQTPVWIALYASLFFVFEMRQQPAFFGIFQNIGGWAFLADLTEPDRFISFGVTLVDIPLLGPIKSLNVLPLLLGFVFYAHQKFLTPPMSATMTPEQQMQQKIIRIVSVVLFPVIMYNAPSGLAIYFLTNSTIAVFENKWIRHGAEKKGLLDLEKIKAEKKKKGPGRIARAIQAAQEKQAMKRGEHPSQQNIPGFGPVHRPGFRPGHEPDPKGKKGKGGKPGDGKAGFKKRK